ncbi:MAG: alpha-L-arabinofuranosidase, partial [Clostridiales bacterium]|nr:alpha-L-arabinofuranosidase [Clostridiales bacterium]
MEKVSCVIQTNKEVRPLGDLFGIFFEDLNHAADGGLYAEMVQNRSFEYDKIDHPDYHNLTGWKILGDGIVSIETKDSLHPNNPHYVRLQGKHSSDGLENKGFGKGMAIKGDEKYHFSCYARSHSPMTLKIEIAGASTSIEVEGEWKQYHTILAPNKTVLNAALQLFPSAGTVDLDMISLFPADTFRGRKNGLRRDIAEALEEMTPRFLRFPGGCLVHDGSLNPDDRDSMYRWKNTIGPVEQRPSRRSNWKYNQTLGLGFYEYFLLCEDIGAKPMPILPGASDPHHKRAAPIEELQPWIDDALDLIEFATGDISTPWGEKRAELGHPAPFKLEMIGIGNEEVGDAFFERFPYFVKAIRER